ncbi:MAG: hypothetical protein HYR88_00575 [Verrucomicrobia bacterium]|nr:hypothetical protein [Verrucomicrobiota bacterium]MBI3871122.1 hypothetical protein [Verrucomicrobiota bacterium]
MSTNPGVVRRAASPSVVPIALILSSAAWIVGVCACYASRRSTGDLSTIPLVWMLMVMIAPPSCFAFGMGLMGARKGSGLSLLDRWALRAAVLPVTVGTVLSIWAAKEVMSLGA